MDYDEHVEMDIFGDVFPKPNTKGMISPVRCCYCGSVYDLTDVTPLARYADCTTFMSPCCNRHVDDRTWKGSPDIKRLDR